MGPGGWSEEESHTGYQSNEKQNNTEHKSKLHQIIPRCSIRSKNYCSFHLKHMLTEKPSAPKSHEVLGQPRAEIFIPGFTFCVLSPWTHQLLKSRAVRLTLLVPCDAKGVRVVFVHALWNHVRGRPEPAVHKLGSSYITIHFSQPYVPLSC